MAPLAFIQCMFYAYLSGELRSVRHFSAHEMTVTKAGALIVNGCLAFVLNIVSFSACSRVGAVSMSVAGEDNILSVHGHVFILNGISQRQTSSHYFVCRGHL